MTTLVNESLDREAEAGLPEPHLASLARTLGCAGEAVRIDDAVGRCVYRGMNGCGRSAASAGSDRFDVFDHTGRVVARVHVGR